MMTVQRMLPLCPEDQRCILVQGPAASSFSLEAVWVCLGVLSSRALSVAFRDPSGVGSCLEVADRLVLVGWLPLTLLLLVVVLTAEAAEETHCV